MAEDTDAGATGAGEVAELRAELKAARSEVVSLKKSLDDFKSDNYDLREKNRQLKARLPEEGDLILKGDELKAWEAFQRLGDPRELKKRLDAGDRAATELGEVRRADSYQQAARLANFRPSVFAKFAKAAGIEVVVQPGKQKDRNGDAVPVPFVKDEGDSLIPLTDYAAKHWPDDLDLLKEPDGSRGTPSLRDRRPPPAPSSGDGPSYEEYLAASGRYGPAG
jgi:hypothetical protein